MLIIDNIYQCESIQKPIEVYAINIPTSKITKSYL